MPVAPRRGRVASGVGVAVGAHVGMFVGGILGTFAYFPFKQPTGGGFDVLIGSFFGVLVGLVAGGALGAYLGLRWRRHPRRGRTAGGAFGILLLGVAVLFLLVRGDAEKDFSGWWYLVAVEGPVLLAALLARRLTYNPGNEVSPVT